MISDRKMCKNDRHEFREFDFHICLRMEIFVDCNFWASLRLTHCVFVTCVSAKKKSCEIKKKIDGQMMQSVDYQQQMSEAIK